MRVAAAAFVLVVGAAVLLAFANTLNTWVLGGLLGGLAAILLSIPISLTLFTLLARRHEARQRDEMEFERDAQEDEVDLYGEPVVYEAEGYALPLEEDAFYEPRAQLRHGRMPVSGYLPLPPVDRDMDDPEEATRRDPRNYPRRPRYPARPLSAGSENPLPSRAYHNPSTYTLGQHQALARRQARQEAQRRSTNRTPARPPHTTQTPPALRPHASRRPTDDDATRFTGRRGMRGAWDEDGEVTEDSATGQVPTRSQHVHRRKGYRPNPRASRGADRWTTDPLDEELEERPGRGQGSEPPWRSGSLQNPLVRRAPYLYEDDPLREEFARQLRRDPPTTRRSSRSRAYEDEEDTY